MAVLPEDIIFNIFVRLPTKPLLRFRFLSKHWNRLISDYFMKSRSRRMILLPFYPPKAIDKTNDTIHSIDLPSFKNHTIMGEVNGILLVVLDDNMMLYNPCTGAFKTIQNPPSKPSSDTHVGYGFCYGSTADDLKIVRLVPDTGVYKPSGRCDVYRLKKGTWRTTSTTFLNRCFIRQCAATFVNGFLYWMAARDDSPLLVALDVKEMVLSEIQFPVKFCWRFCLGTTGGRLHIFINTYAKSELWGMNEDGIKKSWSKVLTSNALAGDHVPLSIIEGGKLVMLDTKNQKKVIIYDLLKDSSEKYEVNTSGGLLWRFKAMEYVESLISPSDLCSSLI